VHARGRLSLLTAFRIADLAAAISCSPPSQLAEKLMRKIGRPPSDPGPVLHILRAPDPEARRSPAPATPATPAKAFAPEAKREAANRGTHRRANTIFWFLVDRNLPSPWPSHRRSGDPVPLKEWRKQEMRGIFGVTITLCAILAVDGFIQPKLGRAVTLVSSRKSLCPSGIRPLIQTARTTERGEENRPYGRGLCGVSMAADHKNDKVGFWLPKMLRRIVPFSCCPFPTVAAEVAQNKGLLC
jgi:hypothetical protein